MVNSPPERMTDEQIRAALYALSVAYHLLRVHDFEALEAALERADALGPLLDPTRARQDAHAWRSNLRLARARHVGETTDGL